MRKLAWITLVGLVLIPVTSSGQETKLREGTEVSLEFDQDVSSATATVDDRINFRLAEDLKLGDIVVTKAGAIAVGTVTHVAKRGHMGKAGELSIRADYLKVGDMRVRLRAAKGKEGESKVGAAVALTVLFGPLGLLKRGHDIEIKKGTKVTAWVDQDTEISLNPTSVPSNTQQAAQPPAPPAKPPV